MSEDKGLAALLGIGSVFLDAVVVMFLWRWFVAPLGPPEITYWHAMGLSLLMVVFTFHPAYVNDERDPMKRAIESITLPLLMWGVGALVRFGVG